MINNSLNTSWFLLDSEDAHSRMFADGFSIFDSKGEYELVDRSMCPVCMRRPFTKATIYLEKIRFLGSLIGDISYNVGSEIIVNNRFIQKWREDDLRGLAFSQDPIQASLKRKSTFSNPDKQFFLALPEARITQFTDEAEVVYPEKPRCRICSSQYVSEIARLSFPPDAIDDTDCCLVSCLPGWLVVSYRFLTFIEEHRLMNITFMEGFQQYEDQTLIRKGYWWQHRDGHLERFPECTEADMEALRQRWPQS